MNKEIDRGFAGLSSLVSTIQNSDDILISDNSCTDSNTEGPASQEHAPRAAESRNTISRLPDKTDHQNSTLDLWILALMALGFLGIPIFIAIIATFDDNRIYDQKSSPNLTYNPPYATPIPENRSQQMVTKLPFSLPTPSAIRTKEPIPVFKPAKEMVLEAQRLLQLLGYNPGSIDGIYGNKTQKAVISFQKDDNIKEVGLIDSTLIERLRTKIRMMKVTPTSNPTLINENPIPTPTQSSRQNITNLIDGHRSTMTEYTYEDQDHQNTSENGSDPLDRANVSYTASTNEAMYQDAICLKSGQVIEGCITLETSQSIVLESVGGPISVTHPTVSKVIYSAPGESELILGEKLLQRNKLERAQYFLQKASQYSAWRTESEKALKKLQDILNQKDQLRLAKEQEEIERVIQRQGLRAGINELERRYTDENEYWSNLRGKFHLTLARDRINHLDLIQAERHLLFAEKYGVDPKDLEKVKQDLNYQRKKHYSTTTN